MFDDHMQMDHAHIIHICLTTHLHLRNIGAISNLLIDSAIEQLIHSLVTSRLDHCNYLLNGMPGYKLKHIQRMQNIRKHRYEPRPQHQGKLQFPEIRLKSYGERSFGFSATTEWIELPADANQH